VTFLDQYSLLFLSSALLLVVAKIANPIRFNDLLRLIGYGTYNQIYKRPFYIGIQWFDVLLFFQFILAFATYLSFVTSNESTIPEFSVTILWHYFWILFVYFFVKRLVELLVGKILKIQNEVGSFIFQKMNSLHFCGLLLLVINILTVYYFGTSILITYSTLFLFTLILLLGFFSTFFRFRFLIRRWWFLFILYLCAFEIAPIVLLWRIFN